MFFDINACQAKFVAKFPHDGERFWQLLQSYGCKRNCGAYHLEQATSSLKAAGAQGSIPDTKSIIDFHKDLFAIGQRREEIENSRLVAQSNIIAAAQTVHSMHDLLNHFCYVGLQLKQFKDLEEHKVDWKETRKLLVRQNKHLSFLNALDQHYMRNDYLYLHAFVNTTKHNSHIIANRSLDFEQNRVGFHFLPFSYRGNSYPSKWMDDFIDDLTNIYVSLSTSLIELETLI